MERNNLLPFESYSTLSRGQKIINESLNYGDTDFDALNEDSLYELDFMAESSDFCTLDIIYMNEGITQESDTPVYEGEGDWLAKSVNTQISRIKPDVEKALKGLEIKMTPTINGLINSYITGLKKALAKKPKTSAQLFDIANQTPEHKKVIKVLVNTYNKILKDNTARAQSSLFSEDNKRSASGLAAIQTGIKEVVFNIKEDGNKNGEKNIIPKTVTNPAPWKAENIKD